MKCNFIIFNICLHELSEVGSCIFNTSSGLTLASIGYSASHLCKVCALFSKHDQIVTQTISAVRHKNITCCPHESVAQLYPTNRMENVRNPNSIVFSTRFSAAKRIDWEAYNKLTFNIRSQNQVGLIHQWFVCFLERAQKSGQGREQTTRLALQDIGTDHN